MAELHPVAPVFAVADIGATIRWYEEQLGFILDPFPAQEFGMRTSESRV